MLFSLEMGRNEITMRLLSAEARVPLHTMRTGQMNDDDWARLARRMSEVADAPLFIDDSPNMSLMEIRAKCRRLKQRNDLKFVIIDYLQLMSSPKRVENRQQEVSEMSRSLKLLAKELEVPVIALSQLNRGPEQRTDKKPLLSDLRESGCMTADTALLRADTGAPVTFGELMRDGWDGVLVWSLDERNRLVPAPVTNVFASGTKEVYRLRLASGREVKAIGQPQVPHAGRLGRPGRAGRRRPSGHPAADPGTDGFRPWLVRAPARPAGPPDRRRLRAPQAAGALHVQRRGEPGLRRGGGGRRVRHHPAPGRPADMVARLPARTAPLHARPGQPNARLVPRARHRVPAVATTSACRRVLYSAGPDEISLFLRHLWATDGCVTVARADDGAQGLLRHLQPELADGVAIC